MKKTFYNTRTWLNPLDSPSCGSIVCYDGIYNPDGDEPFRNMFVAVSDCYQIARLHKTSDDSIEDFLQKLKDMRESLDKFIHHVETVKDSGDEIK